MPRRIPLSAVVPCYNEAPNIPPLRQTLTELPLFSGGQLEIVLVDDGSRDDTWKLLSEWARSTPRVKAVRLFENCGNQHAILAGIHQSSGEAVAVLDADLQDPPEHLVKMLDKLEKSSVSAVIGIQKGQNERGKAPAWLKAAAVLVHPLRPGEVDFCVMKRPVARDLLALGDAETPFCVRRYRALRNHKKAYFSYERRPRRSGQTKFPTAKRAALGWRIFRSMRLQRSDRTDVFIPRMQTLVESKASGVNFVN
ncbi:MAG: glycosyltransferase [Elusimicrobiota bacterium]